MTSKWGTFPSKQDDNSRDCNDNDDDGDGTTMMAATTTQLFF